MTLEQYLIGLKFDLNHYNELYLICDNAIKKGNWEGYSEGLKIRKYNLKKYGEIIKYLESKGIPLYGMWIRGLRVLEEKLQNEQTPKQPPKDNQLSMF